MQPVETAQECTRTDGCEINAIDASMSFDAVVIGSRWQSCVYMVSDAVNAQNLIGPYNKFRFACTDDDVAGTTLPEEPITSIDGGCAADEDFDGIQDAVSQQDGVDWVFGVGDNSQENDKTGLCVRGGANEIARCDEQCIVPTDSQDFPYRPFDAECVSGELDPQTGKVTFPLKCRPCALTEEVAPSNGAGSYCWERANQRAVVSDSETADPAALVFNDNFIKTAVKSTGSLDYIEYEGSTCYRVSMNFRGRVISYWTPAGCP